MSKKITKELFLQRFYEANPNAEIEVLEYTAISNPGKVKCLRCGKEHTKNNCNYFISNYKCCDNHSEKTKYEILVERYSKNKDYTLVKKLDSKKNTIIVRHNVCGNEFERSVQSAMGNLESCPYCNTTKFKNMLPKEEIQKRIDDAFSGEIQILDYNGQLEKNHYKCLKCGLIFKTDQISLMASRGCPKCDRNKSRGEIKMAQYLEEKGLTFKEQVSVLELPLQHFDFCVYDKNNKVLCYIEVNGEQHYFERTIFSDGLKKIQERDERKRQYCKKYNIPLYEIKWFKGQFKNLDILPF